MPYRTPIVTGDRVALAPHTDLWMAGCRYGTVTHKSETVTAVDSEHVYQIRLDTGRVVTLLGSDLLGAVAGTPVGGQRCSHCGAVLVNEDCPHYGNGPEHADASPSTDPSPHPEGESWAEHYSEPWRPDLDGPTDDDLRGALEGWGQ